jgi:hypothetical protein
VELLQARNANGLLDYLAVRRKKFVVPKVNGNRWLAHITQHTVMYS